MYVCEYDTNGAVEVRKSEQGEPEEVAVYSGNIAVLLFIRGQAFPRQIMSRRAVFHAGQSTGNSISYLSKVYAQNSSRNDYGGLKEEGLKGTALLHDSFIETLQRRKAFQPAPVTRGGYDEKALFKHLPADKFTEAIIFAGSEAYAFTLRLGRRNIGRAVRHQLTQHLLQFILARKQLRELKNTK